MKRLNLTNKKTIYSIATIIAAVFLFDWLLTANTPLPKNILNQNLEKEINQNSIPESKNVFLVTRIIDGDTIELNTGERVRYIGIDAPETVDRRRPMECFGKEAAQKNRELVEGKEIRLEKDVSEHDKYGRLLRYVYVGDQFINLAIVQQGYAATATFPPDVKYQELFLMAARQARENNLGLWKKCR